MACGSKFRRDDVTLEESVVRSRDHRALNGRNPDAENFDNENDLRTFATPKLSAGGFALVS